MIEQWIDEIARKIGQIDDGKGRKLLSYSIFGNPIIPETFSVYPCAITYTESVIMESPDSGPNTDMWTGITEFHLAPGTSKANFPYFIRFFSRIRAAFLVDRTLGGKVQYCKLSIQGPSIEGPVTFEPDTPAVNQGLIAHWVVRERYD